MVKTDGEFATIFACVWHLFSQKQALPSLSFTSTEEQTTVREGKPQGEEETNPKGTAAYDGVAFKS